MQRLLERNGPVLSVFLDFPSDTVLLLLFSECILAPLNKSKNSTSYREDLFEIIGSVDYFLPLCHTHSVLYILVLSILSIFFRIYLLHLFLYVVFYSSFYYLSVNTCMSLFSVYLKRIVFQGKIKLFIYIFNLAFRKQGNFGLYRWLHRRCY